jgi:quercetin 2,3-dioxygenase
MKNKSVSMLLYGSVVDMGGIPLRQPFPTSKVDYLDPFLLLHHADIKVPQHIDPDQAGVGPHPHRGFSPVTFIFQGGVHHRDSRGNDNIVYAGGAQWMNAGMGIVHSERPPHDIHERGGRQEIIQLWINTPTLHKMDQPEYFPISGEDVASFTTQDGLATLNVFAGELLGLKGSISSFSNVNASTLVLKKNGKIAVPLPKDHSAFLYLLDGKITLDGFGLVEGHYAVVLKNDGDGVTIEALEDTRILLMSSEPLAEEVATYGPFVMNNQSQIMEAMRDYQMGKMGILIEE